MKIRIPKNTQPIPVSDRIPEVSHEIEVQRTLQELRQLEFVNLLSQNLRQITQSASRTNAQSASRTNAQSASRTNTQSASISSNQSQGRRSWSVFIEQSLFVD
jgi:hypothetical protein